MDPGVRTPLVDFFRRGEVARDIRLVAAQGAFAPAALDQMALLLILKDDPDPEIAQSASATLDILPAQALGTFLGRSDVPGEMRAFFAARGVAPITGSATTDEPLINTDPERDEAPPEATEDDADQQRRLQRLATMSVMQKMKVAMRGTREERALLIRDPNRMVSAAVLSSPKLTENEIESFARMANVGEEVLRVIGMNRSWVKNYSVAANLVRNPKTPIAMSLTLMHRLNDKDVAKLATDRNVPEPIRISARKKASENRSK
jgi:hypothetical protein